MWPLALRQADDRNFGRAAAPTPNFGVISGEFAERRAPMRPSRTQILIYALVLATILARMGKEMWQTWGG